MTTSKKDYYQFTSGLQNFVATLVPEHIIGCNFMFQVVKLTTGETIARIDGSEGTLKPLTVDNYFTPNELKELAALCIKVMAGCEPFQD